jgi:hypothetical protein
MSAPRESRAQWGRLPVPRIPGNRQSPKSLRDSGQIPPWTPFPAFPRPDALMRLFAGQVPVPRIHGHLLASPCRESRPFFRPSTPVNARRDCGGAGLSGSFAGGVGSPEVDPGTQVPDRADAAQVPERPDAEHVPVDDDAAHVLPRFLAIPHWRRAGSGGRRWRVRPVGVRRHPGSVPHMSGRGRRCPHDLLSAEGHRSSLVPQASLFLVREAHPSPARSAGLHSVPPGSRRRQGLDGRARLHPSPAVFGSGEPLRRMAHPLAPSADGGAGGTPSRGGKGDIRRDGDRGPWAQPGSKAQGKHGRDIGASAMHGRLAALRRCKVRGAAGTWGAPSSDTLARAWPRPVRTACGDGDHGHGGRSRDVEKDSSKRFFLLPCVL